MRSFNFALALCLGLMLVSTAATPAPDRGPSASAGLALDAAAAIAFGGCDTNCETGTCDDGKHLNQVNSLGNDGGEIHSCAHSAQACRDHNCSMTLREDVETLQHTLPTLTGPELRYLMRHTDRVAINEKRGAVQVLGCNDQVLVSLNLSPEQYVGLTE